MSGATGDRSESRMRNASLGSTGRSDGTRATRSSGAGAVAIGEGGDAPRSAGRGGCGGLDPGRVRCRTRFRRRIRRRPGAVLSARFLDQAREASLAVVGPIGCGMLLVCLGGIVDPLRRDEHAHEVRGDSGMPGREAQGLGVIRLRILVVAIEGGDDGKSIDDPCLRRRAFCRLPCAAEMSPSSVRTASDQCRAAGAEPCLRLGRRTLGRVLRGFEEVPLGGEEIALLECDVAEPEPWLRGVVEAIGEREVEPARDIELSGCERCRGDRETVLQQLPGVRRILLRRPVGAGGERGETQGRGGRPQTVCEQRLRCSRCTAHRPGLRILCDSSIQGAWLESTTNDGPRHGLVQCSSGPVRHRT